MNWIYGDNVDTDVIIPARYLNTKDEKELANHCMEDIDLNFSKEVKAGDLIIAGENFGCGSSREHAPLAIKASGVKAVIAKSFARIFYRNAINIGLVIIENSEIQLQHSSEEINGIIPVDYTGIANDVKKDDKIYLDDGKLELRVIETDGKIVKAIVIRGGLLKPRKGLNLPGRTASLSAITKKDIEYIKLALEWKVDYLALSFVRTGEDVLKAKHCMEMNGGYIPIIAKIEKPEALDNIDDIIKVSNDIITYNLINELENTSSEDLEK